MEKASKILKWLSSFPGKGMDWLGNVLLLVMFIVILLVGSDAIVQAYYDLHYANAKIAQTLSEVNANLQSLSTAGASQLTPESEAFFTSLDSASRRGLDSNAMSFLVQVFGLSLVSGGVYLLNRSRQNLLVAEKEAGLIKKRIELMNLHVVDANIASVIMGQLLATYHATALLLTATGEAAATGHIALVRDSITLSRIELQQAFQNRRGFELSLHALLLDVVTRIESNLERFKDRERVKDLIGDCHECKRLLVEGKFVENYVKQQEALLGQRVGAEERRE